MDVPFVIEDLSVQMIWKGTVLLTMARKAIAALNVAKYSVTTLISSVTLEYTVTRDHMLVQSAIKPSNFQRI